VYSLIVALAAGVLVGGRLVEVVFYEWPHYGAHPWHVPAVWLGGMSTHGILLGAGIAVWLFCRLHGLRFLEVADVLAVAGAYIMGVGRLGNFIDGQISGSLTEMPWGVEFPDLDGFRHPVVLYDGVKNLLIVPLLLLVARFRPPRGVVFGHAILWYGLLRVFVDMFREYRTEMLGLPAGQWFNLCMAVGGLALALWCRWRGERSAAAPEAARPAEEPVGWWRRAALAALLAVPLVIPSDWTQDVPARYGKRHEGLEYSLLYPRIPSEEAEGPGEQEDGERDSTERSVS
jgi:phosphatidylglycerol:prolipoprotein diacylglycerol transferase